MDISQSRRLISLYKEFKCLWDPTDVNYTNRRVREDVWRQISREMENKPIEYLKQKMRSLAGGYRREKFREKQSRITGSGVQDTYKSKWFAYDDFDFLADKNEPGRTRDTLKHYPTTVTTTEETVEYETIQSTNVNDTVCEPIKTTISLIKFEEEEEQEETSSYQSSNQEGESPTLSIRSFHKSIEEGYSAVKNAAGNDEYDIFGQLVAQKLRKLTPRNRLLAERRVIDIFFDLEQEEMEQRDHTTFPCDPLNNMPT